MKAAKLLFHIFISLTASFLLVGLPTGFVLYHTQSEAPDAVSGASVKLPDKPSGDYVLMLNRSLHEDSFDDWVSFFQNGELNVIFDDINCIAAQSDADALKMADRLIAQLPENQMKLRTENPTLLVSKAENGCIDAAIFSKEMADAMKLRTDMDDNIACIIIKGGEDEK